MGRWGIAAIVVAVAAWATMTWPPGSASTASGHPGNAHAHQAIGMLQYVWGDYSEAVSDSGVIVDPHEFEEQTELLEQVGELLQRAARSSGEPAKAAFLLEELESLQRQVQRAELVDQVQESVTILRSSIVHHYGLRLVPDSIPDLEQGRLLYAEACVLCHGPEGRSRNEVASRLMPPPTDLQEEHLRYTLSPYQAYNLVTYGVPGTSMPSFPSLTDAERWAVAFHVVSLRHAALFDVPHAVAAELEKPLPGITLAELCQSTDAALQDRLLCIGVAPEAVGVVLARLRSTPPTLIP